MASCFGGALEQHHITYTMCIKPDEVFNIFIIPIVYSVNRKHYVCEVRKSLTNSVVYDSSW